ncbi:MAG: acyl-CoA dehydrogenase N-terminal domain-containing protein, partial [Geminicoccaceae bacterium]
MTSYSPPLDHMRFVLNRMIGIETLSALPGHDEVDAELVDQVLEEAGKLATGELLPLSSVGDQRGAVLENGVVRTPDGFKQAYRQFVDGGWNGLQFPERFGGHGLPWTVATAVSEMWH